MIAKNIQSHDGIELNYAITSEQSGKPWIALVMPFGLKLKLAEHFFNFFSCHYNIVAWESRSILEDSERGVSDNEFAVENHVLDMRTILSSCPSDKFIIVGYCSGAGLALGAANRMPQMIDKMILVHGEYAMIEDADCTSQFAAEIDSLLSLAARGDKSLELIFDKISGDRLDVDTSRPDGIDLPFTQRAYLRRYAANYVSYKAADFADMAAVVKHKVFLMTGVRDVQANVFSTEKIAKLLTNAAVYVDPDADHYGILREESNTLVTIWNYLCEQSTAGQRASFA